MQSLWEKYNKTNLILRIAIGFAIGIALGLWCPVQARPVKMLGELFVGALKGVAPLLVFVLIVSSLANATKSIGKRFHLTTWLYIGSTLVAALLAVVASFMFPSKMAMNLIGAESKPTVSQEIMLEPKAPADGVVVEPKADDGVMLEPQAQPAATGTNAAPDNAAINGVVQSIIQHDDAVGAITLVTQESVGEIIHSMLKSMIANPIDCLLNANYVGILFWAVCLGLILRKRAAEATKNAFKDIADGALQLMYRIINFAPFGIIGLAFDAVSTSNMTKIMPYIHLLNVMIGCMLVMGLIINPLTAYLLLGQNPYPLLWACLKRSAVTAFITRSPAANIPVNMGLCRRLGLDEDFYSVTIPLGATIHMNGPAITIVIMAMAVANTVGVNVSIPQAIGLAILASLGACGSAGVVGGSLFVIPMICKFLGIPGAYAMQAVGVGFIIAVFQDSFESALNSSSDVLVTAVVEHYERKQNGEKTVLIPD